MASYKLSELADNDFESLYIYGVVNYGAKQADEYAEGMIERFERLAAHPGLYPAVDHIRQGYRRSVYGAHAIYYRAECDDIVIVRILKRQNVTAALGIESE